jgi:hypothetical protein
MKLAKTLIMTFGVLALVVACEPGDGSSDAETTGTDGTDGTSSTTGTTGTDGTDVNTDTYPVIEIADDANNPTLDPCDTGTLKSPGADIDAAELRKGGSGGGVFLSGCVFSGAGSCENDSETASDAEGAPDGSGDEETDTYVALNGGMLRCSWDGGVNSEAGDIMNVVEIGGTGGTKVEQYQVRFCQDTAGNCTMESTFASGDANFAFNDLF